MFIISLRDWRTVQTLALPCKMYTDVVAFSYPEGSKTTPRSNRMYEQTTTTNQSCEQHGAIYMNIINIAFVWKTIVLSPWRHKWTATSLRFELKCFTYTTSESMHSWLWSIARWHTKTHVRYTHIKSARSRTIDIKVDLNMQHKHMIEFWSCIQKTIAILIIAISIFLHVCCGW